MNEARDQAFRGGKPGRRRERGVTPQA